MTITISELQEQLADAIGGVVVEPLGTDAFRVLVPTGRVAHDWAVLAVERHEGTWVLSDGGQTSRMLDQDFGSVIDVMRCAGAPFSIEGDQLLARADDASLAGTVLSYAHHVTAVPVVWQVRQCMEDEEPVARSVSPPLRMARHTIDLAAPRLRTPGHQHLLHIDTPVSGRGETTRAPLAVKRTATEHRPALVAAYIDATASGQAVTSAKRATSFLFDVLGELTFAKYLVVQGEQSDMVKLRAFYDHWQVNVVAEDDQERLLDDIAESANILLPV